MLELGYSEDGRRALEAKDIIQRWPKPGGTAP